MKIINFVTCVFLVSACSFRSAQSEIPTAQESYDDYALELAAFDEVFKHKETVELKPGLISDYAPLTVSSIVYSDSIYVVTDSPNKAVRIFQLDGSEIDYWGRQGEGPGEFATPEWIGVLSDGTLLVRDESFNFRYQQLTVQGEHIRSFYAGSTGPFTNTFVNEDKGKIISISRAICPKNGFFSQSQPCTIIEHDFNTGEVGRIYGEESAIEPGYQGLPFIADYDYDHGTLWIMHRRGGRLVNMSESGSLLDVVDLSTSPDTDLMDMAALPTDFEARASEIARQTVTFARAITLLGDDFVLLELGWAGPKRDSRPQRIMNILDTRKKMFYHGIHSPGVVRAWDEKRGLLLELDNQDIGSDAVHMAWFVFEEPN